MKTSLCSGWEFTAEWSDDFLARKAPAQPADLPHNPVPMPLHYSDSSSYQLLCGYRRVLPLTREQMEKRLFLQFDGAGHIATVYVNGKEAGSHACGYTAFTLEITDLVHAGENDIAVRLDTSENPAIPPFGFVVDYLTYGGLYREVWLLEQERSYIRDVFVSTRMDRASICVETDCFDGDIAMEITAPDGTTVWQQRSAAARVETPVLQVAPWSLDSPVLYTCTVRILDGERELDCVQKRIGFRTAQFRADGFYLNGEKTFLRGLNRHQCYPYIGYAASASLQWEDARILKQELHCTAVRTSHYPQSQHFIDACDAYGLLVFTEIPGWQHIGGEDWIDQACRNTEEMVVQYRSHPSIVLWGVRINESVDNDDFYRRTNEIAHRLDPDRAASGVRYLEKSSLLEDVYAFNDFSHTGQNPGCKPKKAVTTDMGKGFLISEHNGHMFPTKSFDTWEKRQEHAMRHMHVLNGAYGSGEHAGCFGWCMFDYATHKDFGSGDRICYHGVMDAFRNPKLAAAAYASQGEGEYVLEVCSSMDIGDYPAGQIGEVYVFSNADTVELYKNDAYVTALERSSESSLPHTPFVVNDTIGSLLESEEGFDTKKAGILRRCLTAAGKYGMANLPLRYKLALAWCMLRYRMSYADGVALYGKYVGNWGASATMWRFDAKVGDRVVKSVTKCPTANLKLQVTPSATNLVIGDTCDMAAVRIVIQDEFGNPAPYAQLPVQLKAEGAVQLLSPDTVTAEGGMCGCYLRTIEQGEGRLEVCCAGFDPVTVSFHVE